MNIKILIYCFVLLNFVLNYNESVIGAVPLTQEKPSATKIKLQTIGTHYYVAKTGNDSDSGTSISPFLTIQKAADVANPGDTVIVRDGVYSNAVANYGSEQVIVKMTRSGNSTNWITFKSEHKWGAVLDGLDFATEHGIMFNTASYVRVEGFEIKNIAIWAFPIFSGSNYLEFRDNCIHNIGKICTTTTNGLCAFNLMNANHILIERNLIHDIGRLAPEEGCTKGKHYQWNDHGIYIDGANAVTIRNNIFYRIQGGWAIHFYSSLNYPIANVSILNNTIAFGKRASGLIVLYGTVSNTNIQNNIFYQSADANTKVTPSSNHAISINPDYLYRGVTINHNIVYGGSGHIVAGTLKGVSVSNNIEHTDPKMISPTTFDFGLQSASPAIDAGVNVGLTGDYLGNTIIRLPDIGAYEYRSSYPPPTVLKYSNTKH